MFDRQMLIDLRNNIDIRQVACALGLKVVRKYRQTMFICPLCGFSKATFHPRVNIGRCWKCQRRFNPIELTMAAAHLSFKGAVKYLLQRWDGEGSIGTSSTPPTSLGVQCNAPKR